MSRSYEYWDVTGGGDVITPLSSFSSVYHYDPSTFYNYAQDNKGIDSIEDRGTVLAQALGFPGSAPYSGVTLTVTSGIQNPSAGIYSSVQAAVDDLPRVLTYPVLVEITAFGDLGGLLVNGIKCHGDGALQFKNLLSISRIDVTGQNPYAVGPSPAITLNQNLGGTTLWDQINDTSSLRVGLLRDIADFEDNLNTYSRGFSQISPDSQREDNVINFWDIYDGDAGFSSFDGTGLQVPSYLSPNPWASSQSWDFVDDAALSADIRPVTQIGAEDILTEYRPPATAGTSATCLGSFNYFSSIQVKGSNKVKFDGIFVDGVVYTAGSPPSATNTTENGFVVKDSDILLQDVGITRCVSAGLCGINSRINVSRSFVVSRVYSHTAAGGLEGRGDGVFLQNTSLVFEDTYSADDYTGRFLHHFSHCANGINANNSVIAGGTLNLQTTPITKNAGDTDTLTSHLQASQTEVGFLLTDSVLEFNGRLEAWCNYVGVKATNSLLDLEQFSVDDNQDEGFILENTTFYYGKSSEEVTGGFSGGSYNHPLFSCDWNGVNVKASNDTTIDVSPHVSDYTHVGMWGGNTPLSAGDTTVSSNYLMRNHGYESLYTSTTSPAILLDNNSNAKFIGLGYIRDGVDYVAEGGCILAKNNSQATLIGFGDMRWTTISTYGDFSTSAQLINNWVSTPLLAQDNSDITLLGPTKISRHGIGALCRDNSRLTIGPKYETGSDATLTATRYGLDDPNNHSKVSVQALRACLVAADESSIDIQNLGGPAKTGTTSHAFSECNQQWRDSFNVADVSAGYMVLMPNGFTTFLLTP